MSKRKPMTVSFLPGTGFQPAHSYAISDIETIDNGTGNLSLHIPITQLPPGPGGFTAGLTLSYNNRYWETEPLTATTTLGYGLRESPGGGWRLAMLPHWISNMWRAAAKTIPADITSAELFQLKLTNPDGSRNLFLLSYPAQSMPAACEAGTYRLSLLSECRNRLVYGGRIFPSPGNRRAKREAAGRIMPHGRCIGRMDRPFITM